MANLTQRLLCAAQHTYKINGSTDDLHYEGGFIPESGIIGYLGHVKAFQSQGDGIDASLVGVIPEGILVAIRGTLPPFRDARTVEARMKDWLNNAGLTLKPNRLFGKTPFPGRVHERFAASFSRLWDATRVEVSRRSPEAPKRIYVTGHSKGGSIAVLFAYALAKTFEGYEVIVRTFAAARVVDDVFAAGYAGVVPNHVRFEYNNDPVPHLPIRTALLGAMGIPEWLADAWRVADPGYGSVGDLCYIDKNKNCLGADDIDDAARYRQLFTFLMQHPFGPHPLATDHPLDTGYCKCAFDPLPAGLPLLP